MTKVSSSRPGAASENDPPIAALVLAAGSGSRFDAIESKLVANFGGGPLVRRAVEPELASRAHPTIVVTGHARASIEAALADLPVIFAHNPDYASGMASSLRRGLSQAADCAGVLVLLGDMPGVTPKILDRLIAAFASAPTGCMAAAPVHCGRRGNPVLLAHGLFARLAGLSGDEGAHRFLQFADGVVDVPIEDDGVAADIDTRANLEILCARLRQEERK